MGDKPGIQVNESASWTQPIADAPVGVTAFVGRARCGPVNQPVTLRSMAEFDKVFGGLWVPGTLSYAVEQYFASGGQTAIVVRVAHDAGPATLTLPAGSGALELELVNPGANDMLRAAVDYDGVPAEAIDCFNLTVQRLAAPDSQLIDDQEFHTGVSIDPRSDNCVVTRLATARLARVRGPLPSMRPHATGRPGDRMPMYIAANPDGDDGRALTDTDIVGSAREHTGLFALKKASRFDVLCIPPLQRNRDLRIITWRLAARFCADRRALLLVDAPAGWTDHEAAVDGVRELDVHASNAAVYFPRVRLHDRVLDKKVTFAPCGVVAGTLARMAGTLGIGEDPGGPGARLRPGIAPACDLSPAARDALLAAGVNCLGRSGSGSKRLYGSNTLGGAANREALRALRVRMHVATSVEHGVSWAAFHDNAPVLWATLRQQVRAFLHRCFVDGWLCGTRPEAAYFVRCDGVTNTRDSIAAGKVVMTLGLALEVPGEFTEVRIEAKAGQPTGEHCSEAG